RGSCPMIALYIVIAVVVLLVIGVIVSYNRFVRQRNLVQESWRQIDVELNRRHDLIPNLVETVRGYAAHERGVLEALTQARASATYRRPRRWDMTTVHDSSRLTLEPLLAGMPASTVGAPIDAFSEPDAEIQRGRQLDMIRAAVPAFRQWFAATGTPDTVSTYDLISLPYPTKFGLFRAAISPVPYLTITNRMLIIRWRDEDGAVKTLLFEPSDHELGENTPYFAALASKLPAPARSITVTVHGTVLGHLAAAGVRPEDVDYVVFDHLHTQDVRRLLGTTAPQADIP